MTVRLFVPFFFSLTVRLFLPPYFCLRDRILSILERLWWWWSIINRLIWEGLIML
ncbi:hypothetical protein BJX96DRAFT_151453, partial [Aspergillus floccosus]